jgi:hypothetical protein
MDRQRIIGLGLILFVLWSNHVGGVVGTSGPYTVLVVHESASDTPDQARIFMNLRQGATQKAMQAKGHKVVILDKDSVDADGKPTAILAKYGPFTVPEVVFITASGKAAMRMPLPASADEIARKAGG